jgi:hypothetical protein
MRNVARDLSLYGSFLENHDVERFASLTQDKALIKNVSLDSDPCSFAPSCESGAHDIIGVAGNCVYHSQRRYVNTNTP